MKIRVILFGLVFLFQQTVAQKPINIGDSIPTLYLKVQNVNQGTGNYTITYSTKYFKNDSLYHFITNNKLLIAKEKLKSITNAEYNLIWNCLKEIDSIAGDDDATMEASEKVMLKQGNAKQLKRILNDFNQFLKINFTSNQLDSIDIAPFDLHDEKSSYWEHLNFDKTPAIAAETVLKDLYFYNMNLYEDHILRYWIKNSNN